MGLEGSERRSCMLYGVNKVMPRLVTSKTPKSLRSPICASKRSETA